MSAIEATLSQEEQQTSALDNRYDTAVQNLQTAQNALQTIDASIVRTKAAVEVDRQHLTNDAVKAYIYGTPQSNYASLFSSSATLGDARTQYTQQIVGDLDQARDALQTSESRLVSQKTQEQNLATQASAQAAQAKTLALANQQEAAATTGDAESGPGPADGQEVAQAAVEEAQQEAAGGGTGRDRRARRRGPPRRRKLRPRVAQAVGGSASGAAATTAADAGRRRDRRRVHGHRRRHRVGYGAADGGGRRGGVPAGRPLCLRRGQPVGGLRLLGPGPMGLGAGRSVHPADDRGAVARASPTSRSDALEPGDLLFYYNLDSDRRRSTTWSCTSGPARTAPTR